MLKTITGAVCLGLVMVAAGCGGDDKDSKDSGVKATNITKAEFVAKADAYCQAGDAKIAAAVQKLGANPSNDEVVKVAQEKLLPALEEQVDSIKALGAPEGDEATIKAMTDSLTTAIDRMKADPKVITGSDNPLADATAKAKAYGLKVCGQG